MGVSPIFYLCRSVENRTGWQERRNKMQLVELIEQAVGGLGYELVEFETSPRARLLRVFIDVPAHDRGVTIEDCTAVSNHLSHLFTVENVDYDRLEVSSPGLDRPLKKPADFLRFIGHEISLRLRMPVGNQRNFVGTLLGLDGEKLRLQTEREELVVELPQVEKARLVPKF